MFNSKESIESHDFASCPVFRGKWSIMAFGFCVKGFGGICRYFSMYKAARIGAALEPAKFLFKNILLQSMLAKV